MQAIYEAILLIPNTPSQATRILFNLAKREPNFINLLKQMTLQLYHRYNPQSQSQHSQYETICKQMLVILNRFIKVSFQQKGNDNYLNIENYYNWIIEIFLCEDITLTSKKSLTSSFTKVLDSICYQPQRIVELNQHLERTSMKTSSCLFLYLDCLMDSSVEEAKKVESVMEAYLLLYDAAISEYTSLINFYNNRHMEVDPCEHLPNSNFLQRYPLDNPRLKQNEFVLSTLLKIFKLIESIFLKNNNYHDFGQLTTRLFFDPNLAKYISSFLKIEEDLFSTNEKQNLYGLKLVIVTNLRSSEKNIINQQKSKCLQILRIILSLTDKSFNLQCTDKLLMKELFNIANLIINELLICSEKDVISTLSVQLQISEIIASMFNLLSVIVHFQDLKSFFSSLTMQKIIRLAFFYSKTFEQELKIYEDHSEQYVHFNYYICDQPKADQEIDNAIDDLQEFSIKRKAVKFIKEMSIKIEGFHSILMDICFDIITLEMKLKIEYNTDYRSMFAAKYHLNQNIFSCFDLETALFLFTILIQKSWESHQKSNRMASMLSNIRLSSLNNLEMYRLYICLAVNHELFILHKGHMNLYHFIERVYKLDNKTCSVTQAGYYFLQKLIKYSNGLVKNYDIFVQKLLNQLVEECETAWCIYPFQTIQDALKIKNTTENIINLDWINRCMAVIIKRIVDFTKDERKNDELFNYVLKFYYDLMKEAERQISSSQDLPYPTFQSERLKCNQLASSFVTLGNFRFIEKILKQRQWDSEDEVLIENFSSIILEILTQQLYLPQPQIDMILTLILTLLSRREQFQHRIKKITFNLLYQIISIRIYTFDQRPHNSILNWMKQTYYSSQIGLNRVCIILQELYYYIDGNLNQNQANFLSFFQSIIQLLEKKFLQLLFQYHNCLEALEEELDSNIKKINELRIEFDPIVTVKTNPITIIRLYNTILLNPYFDITIIRKIHELIKKYNFQIVPAYDLTMQVLALESLIKRSSNISVVECFRFTTELMDYNSKHPQKTPRQNTQIQKEIANLTEYLHSSLTQIDPYEAYCILLDQHVFRSQSTSHFSSRIDEITISLLEFLRCDKYMMNMVKKLSQMRNVNKKTRMIVKIKKNYLEDE